jgi:glutamine synthetase
MAGMTGTPLAAAAIAQLEAEGVDAVIGTVVNPAGLTLAKTVPIRRTNTFADPGLGASPSWHAFAIDQTGIAFTHDVGVVGDQRLRIDLSSMRIIGDWPGRRPPSSSRTAHPCRRAAGEP